MGWSEIWIARIKETDKVSIHSLLRIEDRKRYKRIIPSKKKRNFAFRRAVLNFVLQRYVESYSIKNDTNGKPYIVSHGSSAKVYFSSSSSAGLCVVAVSGDMIGVDIEIRGKSVDLVNICEKYVSDFININVEWKKSRIVKQLAMCAWCRLEAFVKLNGFTLHEMLFAGKQDNQSEIASLDTVISGNDFVCVVSQFENIELKNIYYLDFEKIHYERVKENY